MSRFGLGSCLIKSLTSARLGNVMSAYVDRSQTLLDNEQTAN